MLLAADALARPTMKVFGYGGAPIRSTTMRRLQDLIPDAEFVNLFRQTDHRLETGGPSTRRHEPAELLRSVGKAAPGATVVIHEPDEKGMGEV